MKASASTAAALIAHAGYTFAALCQPGSLLGLGAATDTLTGQFTLAARSSDGTTYPIVNSLFPQPGGFFLPTYLGAANTDLSSFTTPKITLQNGIAYASGGTVFATMKNSLLQAEDLYIAADSSAVKESWQAVNATCDGEEKTLLRFANLTPIPLATASINQTEFATGAGLKSPILDGLLTSGTPIDLVIVPYTAN